MQVTGRYEIDDVLIVANSLHGPAAHRQARRPSGPEHDHLASAAEALAFLRAHRMEVPSRPPTGRELDALRELRDTVHHVVAGSPVASLALATLLRRASFRLDARGRLEATATSWPAVIADLLLPLLELVRCGDRLRRCQNGDCRWLFIDRSRNQSRRWCEMGACGNRAKSSRFRGRRTEGPAIDA